LLGKNILYLTLLVTILAGGSASDYITPTTPAIRVLLPPLAGHCVDELPVVHTPRCNVVVHIGYNAFSSAFSVFSNIV